MTDATQGNAVYVVIDVQEIYDGAAIEGYRVAAHEQMMRRGGEILGRGGSVLEGSPAAPAITVQRWNSAQDFIDWQESDEYRPLRDVRLEAMKLRISIVPSV